MENSPVFGASWRLFEPHDLTFAYQLASIVDPRWWAVSRSGLSPQNVVARASTFSAGVVVVDSDGYDTGLAVLRETGTASTGALDVWALPTAASVAAVESVIVELLASAFTLSNIRALYHDRFENDPYLLGATESLWETEVVYPEFALIDGRYESRATRVLQRDKFEARFARSIDVES